MSGDTQNMWATQPTHPNLWIMNGLPDTLVSFPEPSNTLLTCQMPTFRPKEHTSKAPSLHWEIALQPRVQFHIDLVVHQVSIGFNDNLIYDHRERGGGEAVRGQLPPFLLGTTFVLSLSSIDLGQSVSACLPFLQVCPHWRLQLRYCPWAGYIHCISLSTSVNACNWTWALNEHYLLELQTPPEGVYHVIYRGISVTWPPITSTWIKRQLPPSMATQ